MDRARWVRVAIVAGVVALVAVVLALAGRRPEGPPTREPGLSGPLSAPGAVPPGSGESTAVPPAETGSPAGAPPAGTGPAGGTGTAPGDLPPDHPPLEPLPDERSQVSLQWLGQSMFIIQSPGQVVVVTDPFDPKFTGYGDAEARGHLVTVSHEHPDHNATAGVQPFVGLAASSVKVVRGGTARQGDVSVTAIPAFHDNERGAARGGNRLFLIEAGALRLAHLGDLGHLLTPEQVRALGRVDVLLVPVGGFYTIGPDEAAQVVKQLNPRLVIPMHYRTDALNPSLAAKLRPVEDFTVKFPGVEFKDDHVALVAGNTLPKETTVWVLKHRGQQ